MANKEEIIKKYVQENDRNARQGTSEWVAHRAYSIGGSDVSIITGANCFKGLRELLLEKLSTIATSKNDEIGKHMYQFLQKKEYLRGLPDNVMICWGNIFEKVITRYVSKVYNCTVYGDNMFINNDSNDPTSFSPDGLAHINNEIVLLEFKCPYGRNPGNTIPNYYYPQVQYGLCLIDIAERGLFVDASFRPCSLSQVYEKNPDYNTAIMGEVPKINNCTYCDSGIVIISNINEEFEKLWNRQNLGEHPYYYSEYNENIGKNEVHSIINELDIGKFQDKQLFDKCIREWHNDKNTVFTYVYKNDYDEIVNIIKSKLLKYKRQGRVILGILPWKLVKVSFINVSKDTNFIDNYYPIIKSFINDVKYLTSAKHSNQYIEKIIDKYAENNSKFEEIDYTNEKDSDESEEN